MREQARAQAPLTVEALRAWQRLVLGPDADVSLRKHHAWAKEGRERYGVDRLARRLEEALAGTADEGLDPIARPRAGTSTSASCTRSWMETPARRASRSTSSSPGLG